MAGAGDAVRNVEPRLARDAAEVRAVAAGLGLVDDRDGPAGLAGGAGGGQAGGTGAQHEQVVAAHRRASSSSARWIGWPPYWFAQQGDGLGGGPIEIAVGDQHLLRHTVTGTGMSWSMAHFTTHFTSSVSSA